MRRPNQIFEELNHKLILKQKLQRPSNKLFGFVWDSLQDRIVPLANKRSQRYEFTLNFYLWSKIILMTFQDPMY